MPRLIPQSYSILIQIFKKDGFSISRFEGNHYILNKPGIDRPVIIPKYKEVGVDIITANMRTAGMSRKRYFELFNQIK